ncbi:EH signature domain-containing protein [Photobacterium damselae]|uniref:EH signature domain-containing protein n=1 Tax=Photobacterium damselae TaxID=38293 RepID=UPI001EFD7E07|nr:EH signature domain-containing protein [Photobacterium damselae]MCG9777581.1 EH signature domain-containing protein [Photobacterium damselae]
MKNSVILFAQPSLPSKVGIEKNSFDDFIYMGEDETVLPSFPPKTLLQIVNLVDAGRADEISIFEWLEVTENIEQWTELTDDQSLDACRAIWMAICCNTVLGDIAFFKVALAIDGKPSSIVPQLLETMSIVRTVKGLDALCLEKIDWLLSLQAQQHRELANICWNANLTPYYKTKWLRLPLANTYLTQIQQEVCSVIDPQSYNEKSDNWLYQCFLSLQTTKDRIAFCERFILRFSKSAYSYLCGKMIEERCLPFNEDCYWYLLRESAKEKLKNQFGLSNYYELHGISRLLSQDNTENALGFDEQKRRQIHSRTMFWSNYTKHFKRIRALLPESSFYYIAQFNNGLPPFVDKLASSESQDSEVYIFELSKLIVVEFLRGGLSETRFFNATDWNLKRLFDSRELSIDDIRSLSQQEVHDHLVGWQYFCEKLLRIKFKLVPTTGKPYFKGLPPRVNSYSETKGLLIAPDPKMMTERKTLLAPWVEQFWNVEFKTGKYGEFGDVQKQSSVYLAKALMAKQLGNHDEYEMFIRKAADQGNPEAMWQLGRTMLLGARSTPAMRKQGEDWVGKAASLAHHEARETATRFRIPFVANVPPKPEETISLKEKSELESCLASLAAVREWDQQQGLKLAKKLLSDADDKQVLLDALVTLLSKSQRSEIREDITAMLQQEGDINTLMNTALALSNGSTLEQIKAIEIYEHLHESNVDVKEKVNALVKFADDYQRRAVLVVGLRTLSNLGDLDATYRLAKIMQSSESAEERQLGLTLMSFAAGRGHDKAKEIIKF